MKISLYTFSKRNNSTKRPSTGGLDVDVKLKDGTSIYQPSFTLTGNSILTYNYLKWDDRYYFIDDIIYTNALHQIDIICIMDYLATYKSNILSTTAFISYSTALADSSIPDQRLSTKAEPIITGNEYQRFVGRSDTYIVNLISDNGATTVGVSESNFKTLVSKLNDDGFFDSLVKGEGTDYISKSLNSVSDAITSAHVLPIAPTYESSIANIHLGSYATGVSGGVPSHEKAGIFSIDIPWNFTGNDFRNRSQYTSLLLYLPGYGVVQLNPDELINKDSIVIKWNLDPYVGGLTYLIDGKIKCDCVIASSVAIGSNSTGIRGTLAAGASMALGAVTGNPAAFFGGMATAAVSNMSHTVGSIGSNGGQNSYNVSGGYVYLTAISHNTTVEPSSVYATMGGPSMKTATIPSSGYVQTVNASVAISGPQSVSNILNSYLNGGVYIE